MMVVGIAVFLQFLSFFEFEWQISGFLYNSIVLINDLGNIKKDFYSYSNLWL